MNGTTVLVFIKFKGRLLDHLRFGSSISLSGIQDYNRTRAIAFENLNKSKPQRQKQVAPVKTHTEKNKGLLFVQ